MNKQSEYPKEPFIRGDYDALSEIIKELAKFDKNNMEYGYDIDFPQLYQSKHEMSRNQYVTNLFRQHNSVQNNYSKSPQRKYGNYINEKVKASRSFIDNQISNKSTIAPRASSSKENLMEKDTFTSK